MSSMIWKTCVSVKNLYTWKSWKAEHQASLVQLQWFGGSFSFRNDMESGVDNPMGGFARIITNIGYLLLM